MDIFVVYDPLALVCHKHFFSALRFPLSPPPTPFAISRIHNVHDDSLADNLTPFNSNRIRNPQRDAGRFLDT